MQINMVVGLSVTIIGLSMGVSIVTDISQSPLGDCDNTDYNNDGINDLVVGSTGFDNSAGSTARGGVFIYYGQSNWSSSLNAFDDKDVLISYENGLYEDIALANSVNNSDYWGASVKFAGDLNNDGYDDLILGAYLNETTGRPSSAGGIYLIY